MTDEKFLFFQDSREKSLVARSSHNRRTHNGKGGCHLPSDFMTNKELKAMNGEIETYRTNTPLLWKEFKSMPEDLQRQYIRDLQLKYGATASDIGKMFGVCGQSVLNAMKRLGVASFACGARMSENEKKRWRDFVGGAETEEVSSCEEQVTAEEETAVEEIAERMELDCFTACVTGRYSPEAMLAILGTMPIPDGKCTIRIEVTKA